MNDWIRTYFLDQLRQASENYLQHTQLLKELQNDSEMQHALNQARDYEIRRMFHLCRQLMNLDKAAAATNTGDRSAAEVSGEESIAIITDK